MNKKGLGNPFVRLLVICMLAGILQISVEVVKAAEFTTIPTGDYTISTNGSYQLTEGYTGIITIVPSVNTVKVIGSSEHADTGITIEGGRTEAIDLTIDNLDITSQYLIAPIDFSNAGDFPHKLSISGVCKLENISPDNSWDSSAALHVPDGVQLIINRAAGLYDDLEAQLTAISSKGSSAIGGSDGEAGGTITIEGGLITANGGIYGGAGIGGGKGGAGSDITISGGTITATGGSYGLAGAAGIGGGQTGSGTNITISGGTVIANGGYRAAGIGGGGWTSSDDDGSYGSAGNITVSSGMVTAIGGTYGAGIGGGISGTGSDIEISGGIVSATGGTYAAGIGGGHEGSAGNITISGGTVTAVGGTSGGAGIGGGYKGNGGSVTITGNPVVIARGSNQSMIGEHIGKGASGGDSGRLRNDSDEDLAYIHFDASGIADIKLTVSGIGERYTNTGGFYSLIVPRSGIVSYTAGKAGYAAISGTQTVSYMNHTIDLELVLDSSPPTISNVAPAIMNEHNPVEVTCSDYGIYGALYMVPKTEETYTSKSDLDEADVSVIAELINPIVSASIDTSGLDDGTYQVYAVDSAENVSSPSEDVIIDTTFPTVELSHNNAYAWVREGDELTITAAFNEHMEDTPAITITSTDVTDIGMNNATGDGRTWIYTWAVPDGNISTTVMVTGKDIAGNDYQGGDSLTLIIDNISPEVLSVEVPEAGTYVSGQNLDFIVEFSETIVVADTPHAPSITVDIGGNIVQAGYAGGSGTTECLFRYEVRTGDLDTDGITLGSEIALNNGIITDKAGNDLLLRLNGMNTTSEILADAVSPIVVSVDIPDSNIYLEGMELDFTVRFSEEVTVNTDGGTPSIPIILDAGDGANACFYGSAAESLTFRYTVQEGHEDLDGIVIGDEIVLNGGTIKDSAGNDAVLVLNGMAMTDGVRVDTIAPVLISADVTDDNHITVTLREDCTNISKDGSGGFTVNEILNPTITYEVLSIEQGADAGHVILTTADMGVSAKEGITVKYMAGGDGTVQDMAENEMITDDTGVTGAAWDTTAPAIHQAVIGEGNSYIDITFTEQIYGADNGMTALTREKLALIFTRNGGDASDAAIGSLKQNDSPVEGSATELMGGETTVRVFLTVTGTPSGFETIEIKPEDGNSIYDKAGNVMEATQTTGISTLYEQNAPITGDGTLSVSRVTHNSVDLVWIPAADGTTAQEDLQYKVVKSASNNIDSVNNAEAQGTLVEYWTSGLTEKRVTGLVAHTTYYFNVIVRDQAGNKAVYTTVSVETSAAPANSGGRSSNTVTYLKLPAQIISGEEKLNLEIISDNTVGNAAVLIDEKLQQQLFEKAEPDENGRKTIVLEIPEVESASSYTLEASVAGLSLNGTETGILLKTVFGTVEIPGNMLAVYGTSAGEKAAITIGQGDKDSLPDDVKETIGERPLIQLTLEVGNKKAGWNNPDAPVTVSIPYIPTAEELKNPEHIVVWYIDQNGNSISVPNGRYDPAAGVVTFSTTHFSNYAVVYVTKTFDDLGDVSWAKRQIEVLASRDILKGVTENKYVPQQNITRGDFLYSLVRTLGINAVVDGNFIDVSSDDYYYNEIAQAKKIGITNGTGNGKYSPDVSIMRQDMMVLIWRALSILKKLETQGTDSDLERFADKSLIAPYAMDSVASVVKEGLIVGSSDKIKPRDNTTRAEAATVLYRISH